mmetsp:Transcript_4470/g.13116  ORF Transcript_4470/g.13116 Transcript_4470/m.13116 type:complete len:259 (+) Transcript_4470:96-872(+)
MPAAVDDEKGLRPQHHCRCRHGRQAALLFLRKHGHDPHLVVQVGLLLRGDLPSHELRDARPLGLQVGRALLFDLLHDLHVDLGLLVVLVLALRKGLGLRKVRVLEAAHHELPGRVVKLGDGANGRHLDAAELAQPEGQVLDSDVLLHGRLPLAVLVLVPGRRLLGARIRETLEPAALLDVALEEDVGREFLLRQLEALAQVFVLLVAVLLHGDLRDEEVRHRVRQLAELLERVLLLAVRVRLVELRQQREARHSHHFV